MSSLHLAFAGERIGVHHMALYRSWLSGLDLRAMGLRYLGSDDARLIERTLQGLRQRFIQAAHRAHKPRYARLLATKLPAVQASLQAQAEAPDLQRFAEEIDPDGFYSEEELLRLYEERFGQDKIQADAALARLKRRQRWIEQQEEALFWIERFLVARPMLEDALEGWMAGSAVQHLRAAGIATLGDLKAFIERHGKRWHDRIAGIGQPVAQRIVQWFEEYEADLGALDERAHLGRLELARLSLPQGLPAVLGQSLPASAPADAPSALPVALIEARDDAQALQAWVAARAGSAHTARAYRKEGQRFLLFLAQECDVGLRQLKVEHCLHYRTFLALLGRVDERGWTFRVAQQDYMAPRNMVRGDVRWRPFEGPLSAASAQQALRIVQSMLDYLVEVRYLSANPMRAISAKVQAGDMRTVQPGLSAAQWHLVRQWLQGLPASHEAARLRFVLELAYGSAMRLSELAAARSSHLATLAHEHQTGVHLMLSVLGKGRKWRNVYLGEEVQRAWSDYAAWRGLPTRLMDLKERDEPLAATLAGAAMSVSALYKLIKSALKAAGAFAREQGLWDDAQHIAACSPHDLRHSRARHLVQAKVALPIVQHLLGHSSIATTGRYTRYSDLEMAQALSSV